MTAAHDWSATLDALEEWLRRTRSALVDGGPTPAVITLPGSPVPAELRLRALVLQEQMQAVEAEVLRRRNRLERAHAYQQ